MITRPNLYTVPGGDTIQIIKTAEHLREKGVEVDICISPHIDYNNYSLLHFFNIIDPEDILGHLYKTSKPFVISTIYVDYREYDKFHRTDFIGTLSKVLNRDSVEYIKTLAKYVFKNEKVSTNRFFLKGHKRSIQYILKKAALLLPNSQSEYNRLEKDYYTKKKYVVVPNAIDLNLFKTKAEALERNIILCVARIEGRKNQLNIIRALKNTAHKIVFVGAVSPNQKDYYDQCKREATANMQFIDFMAQEQLIDYYCKAKVHILASWFETTGLSNLEAGAMGCNLVVSKRGDVMDYFNNLVEYCEPEDLESIKLAVDKAWSAPNNNTLMNKIKNNYTWQHTAELTFSAYQTVLTNDTVQRNF